MIGQYGRAGGINKCFLWKGAPGRNFGLLADFGFFQCFMNKTGFGHFLIKTRLGLLNQADLDLIPKLALALFFLLRLIFLCALIFWNYKAILPREGGIYIFLGIFHIKVI